MKIKNQKEIVSRSVVELKITNRTFKKRMGKLSVINERISINSFAQWIKWCNFKCFKLQIVHIFLFVHCGWRNIVFRLSLLTWSGCSKQKPYTNRSETVWAAFWSSNFNNIKWKQWKRKWDGFFSIYLSIALELVINIDNAGNMSSRHPTDQHT